MKVRYRLVYCRKGVFRGDGRALVQVEAAQHGRKKYFSSNVYVLPRQWDGRRKLVVDHPNADALNAYLFEMVVSLEKIELDLWKKGINPTLERIKEGYVGDAGPEMTFHAFCECAIRKSVRRESTKKSLMGTLKSLDAFQTGFSWVDLTLSSVRQFEAWLINKGYARNTAMKHLRNLRTLVNEAIDAGYIYFEDNPFSKFRIVQHKAPHRFLSPEELSRMESLGVTGRLRHIRDAFLFCCYTGLRFSDFCAFESGCLYRDHDGVWIKMKTRKTGVEVQIPLDLLFDGKGLRILRGYDSAEDFAKLGGNSKVNAALKVLQQMADIRTHLTFHVARHTCATLLCYQGVPVTTVQKILGHTKVSTTQIYQEVMNETIVKDLKRANASFGK